MKRYLIPQILIIHMIYNAWQFIEAPESFMRGKESARKFMILSWIGNKFILKNITLVILSFGLLFYSFFEWKIILLYLLSHLLIMELPILKSYNEVSDLLKGAINDSN